MGDSSQCGLCGVQDSWRHSLLECTSSRSVWALSDNDLTQQIISTTEPNAKQWLFTLMELLPHDKFVLLAVTLWAIWHARRKAIHEAIFQSPQATNIFIKRFLEDLAIISSVPNKNSGNAPLSHAVIKPKRPPTGFCKIHVDAGVRHTRGGSAVAICRDEDGNFMGSSALVIEGLVDPPTLEAIACREALSLAEDLNIHHFIIASDCQQVVSDIHKNARGKYGAIISEINLKASILHCNFGFESRAVNYEAHRLAKFSLSRGPGRHVWFGAPYDQNRIPHHADFDE